MLVFPSWCVHHGLQAIYIGGPGSLSYFPQCLLPPIMCLRFCVYMRVSPSSNACACNARRPRMFCPTHHNASSHRSIVCGYTHHEFLSELIWTSSLTYKMFGEALSRPFFPQRLCVPFAMQAMWPLPHHTKAVLRGQQIFNVPLFHYSPALKSAIFAWIHTLASCSVEPWSSLLRTRPAQRSSARCDSPRPAPKEITCFCVPIVAILVRMTINLFLLS